MYDWIDLKQEAPTSAGKYIVKTISNSKLLKTTQVIEVRLFFNSSTRKLSWDCSNQTVTYWLKKIS